MSFRLDECRFREKGVDFVGHNLTVNGNYPARSIFDLVKD